MSTEIKIKRDGKTKRFWVYIVQGGRPRDHLRAFLFNDDEDAAYGLAEVFADGIVRGFRIAPDLLPKDVEYLQR